MTFFGVSLPQSVALYILGDESAVLNEASHYLYKITSGRSALAPSWERLKLGEHGINTALSFLGQRKQQMEQDDNRYEDFWCCFIEFVTSC